LLVTIILSLRHLSTPVQFMITHISPQRQQFPFCSRDFQIASVFPRKAPCAIAKSRLRPDFFTHNGNCWHRENAKISYLGVFCASVVKQCSPRIDICSRCGICLRRLMLVGIAFCVELRLSTAAPSHLPRAWSLLSRPSALAVPARTCGWSLTYRAPGPV